ncbi:hypothetical protein P9990_17590 [Prescottella equi]|uniref:hypothetical protein n=1 Tax=Rhodococcus hoagii TaxID=43767 RepID=UPI002578415B|nr:hypothetical protein [Prescottella equi]WJJ10385.1 hypothetical protein P9990_17590 [Prescottella equi]
MAGARRTVRVGSISYVDAHGAHRRADVGSVVEVHDSDIDRFDTFNRLIGESPEEALALSSGGARGGDRARPSTSGDDAALAARAAELDARAAALTDAEAALAQRAAALDTRAAEIETKAAELDARPAAVDEKATEVKKPAARASAKKPATGEGE